ncbi:MAG: hypothetical protein BGO49_28035 [Planctomycetales bacterium 71-10]|nr:MAG: hypothetical protein BGO49_28035 [Planctomycetales bacterium 71-10]
MPPRSARTILHVLTLFLGILSLGDRGLHRLTGTEHGPSHAGTDEGTAVSAAEADGACPLCRLASEPSFPAGAFRPHPFDRPIAPAEAALPAGERPIASRDAAASRAPPASA